MRKFIVVFGFVAVSLTPTFANPPLCEGRGKDRGAVKGLVSVARAEKEVAKAEPAIFLLSQPRRVEKFTQFSVRDEERPGEFRMVIHSRPPAPDWAKVSTSSD